MSKSVGIIDIAKALGLSRNTVSKALNGSSGITNITRQRVIDQAIRMNYKMMGSHIASGEKKEKQNILLVCKDSQLLNDFFGPLMLELQQLIYQCGTVMTVQYMRPQDIQSLTMPALLQSANGVIGLEILDKKYIEALLAVGKPCVFFDCAVDVDDLDMPFDIVLEEDRLIYRLIREAAQSGDKTFGFVGSIDHCMGFHHRYDTFRLALSDEGFSNNEAFSILFEEDGNQCNLPCFDNVLSNMQLPNVVCFANSYLCYLFTKALHARDPASLQTLKMISFGANHIHQQYVKGLCSKLTTVKTDRKSIASALVMLIFDRMAHPDISRRTLFTKSHIQRP